MKLDILRDLTIPQRKFTNLLVYKTGGKSKLSLYESNRNLINTEDQVSMPPFMNVIKLSTKRGIVKAELLHYFTSCHHSVTHFNDMLLRLKYFEYNDSTNMLNEMEDISNKLKNITSF